MKITYRPEIDGLRAIAVLAVIIYHFKIDSILPGGYLGVDIFFVISGFLISSIIIKELSRTGSFSFINFYKRRIRRLMPVFFVVLLTSTVAAWFILLPIQFSSFAKSAFASIFFFSNHYWYSTSLDYDAQSSLLEPLLHTWTLSVEEQFYIVFPCLLVLVFICFKRYLLSIILVLTLVSLVFAHTYISTDKSFCFYLLPARFWELSAGCILAILNYKDISFSRNHFVLKNLSSIFLLLLVPCFFFFNGETKHPGLITVIPVLATMGMLFFAHKEDLATKLLSSRPFVFIGLLSYSLYLWHFPVFAFGRNLRYENSIADFSIWIGLTFLLSFLSYKFIEQPYRNKTIVNTKKFTLTIIALFTITIMALSTIVQNEGFSQRFESISDLYFGNEIDNMKLKNNRQSYYDKVFSEKSFDQGHTNVLIIGDSHSKDLFHSFYLNKDSYKDYSFHRIALNAVEIKTSMQLLENDFVKKSDIVIICYRVSKKTWIFEEIEGFVDALKTQNKRVIISLNIGEFNSSGRHEVFDEYVLKYGSKSEVLDLDHIRSYFYDNRRENINIINDSILSFAKKMDIEFIDRYSLVCNDETKSCNGITPDGKKAYCDGSHLSLAGAKYFGTEMRKRDCLIKTNFVSKDFETSEKNLGSNIKMMRAGMEEEKKELYEKMKVLRLKLKDKSLTPEERHELRHVKLAKLKVEWKALKEREREK